jgi:hypothetical protein
LVDTGLLTLCGMVEYVGRDHTRSYALLQPSPGAIPAYFVESWLGAACSAIDMPSANLVRTPSTLESHEKYSEQLTLATQKTRRVVIHPMIQTI